MSKQIIYQQQKMPIYNSYKQKQRYYRSLKRTFFATTFENRDKIIKTRFLAQFFKENVKNIVRYIKY